MICWLANALSNRGYNVTLFSLDEPGAASFYNLDVSVNWIQLGIRKGIFDKFRRVKLLSSELRKKQIKVLIGFVISGDKTVYAAAKIAKTCLVVAERNAPSIYDIRYTFWQKSMCFFMMRFADCITVQSEKFIKGYPLHLQKKITSIPNPVKKSRQNATADVAGSDQRYVVLAVCRLDEIQKGVSYLIEAFAAIQSNFPLWDLHIVGGGSDEEKYLQLIKKYNLESRIKLFKERKDIYEFYLNSHLFVMPSRWEGFPNALAEAMAAGLPVIGFSEAEGVSDLISEDVGWLAEGISDSVSLSKTLKIAMNSHYERKAKGLQAIKVMDNYAEEIQIEKWIKLINRVTNE